MSKLRAGDWIEVRSEKEILKILDPSALVLRDGSTHYPQSARLLILTGTAAYALACLLVLRTSVPFLLNLDNGYFLPISFYWKNTGILNNPWLNWIGSGMFNWHGFIQPYLVGLLSFRPGWSDVYFGLNLFASLAILAVVYGVWALRIRTLEGVCIIVIALSVLLDVRARPEVLAMLASVSLVTLLGTRRRLITGSIFSPIVVGIIFGMLFCGHPAIFGLLVLAFIAFFITISASEKPCFRSILLFISVVSLAWLITVVFCFLVIFHGYPWTWLTGILQAAHAVQARADTQGLFKYFMASRYLPGLGLGFALLAICGFAGYQKITESREANHILLFTYAMVALISLLLIYRLAVRVPSTYYNFSGLLAALTLVAASYACVRRTAIEGTALNTRATTTILVVMALLCGAAQAIWIVQVVKEHGKATTNALLLSRSLEEELRLNNRVCADSAALAATPDLETAMAIRILVPWSVQEEKPSPAECDIYIQVQGQKNLSRPITPPGFALVMDRFNYDPQFIAVRPLNLAFAIFAAK
jgi:hypothetical protein